MTDYSSQVQELLEAAGVPSLFRNTSIDTRLVPRAVTEWWKDLTGSLYKPGGMILAGPPGTGKTMAAVATLRIACDLFLRARERGDTDPPRTHCAFARSMDIVELVRSNTPMRREKIVTARLLVIDDWRGAMPDWIADGLDDLVDRRYTEMRPTIITTNLPAGASAEKLVQSFERLFPRAASRLLDKRGPGLVIVKGKDLRGVG